MEKTVARRGFIGGAVAALAGVGCAVIGEASRAEGLTHFVKSNPLNDWTQPSCQPTCNPVKPEPMALEREWNPTAEHWAHAVLVAIPLEHAIGYMQEYGTNRLVECADPLLYLRQRREEYAIPFEAVVLGEFIDHRTAQGVLTVSHPSFPAREPGTAIMQREWLHGHYQGVPAEEISAYNKRRFPQLGSIRGIAVE